MSQSLFSFFFFSFFFSVSLIEGRNLGGSAKAYFIVDSSKERLEVQLLHEQLNEDQYQTGPLVLTVWDVAEKIREWGGWPLNHGGTSELARKNRFSSLRRMVSRIRSHRSYFCALDSASSSEDLEKYFSSFGVIETREGDWDATTMDAVCFSQVEENSTFFEEKTEEKEEEENEGEEREIDDGVLFEEPEKKEECKLPVIADVGEMGKMMALSHLFHRSLSEKVEGIVLVEGNARFRFDWPLVWSELVEEEDFLVSNLVVLGCASHKQAPKEVPFQSSPSLSSEESPEDCLLPEISSFPSACPSFVEGKARREREGARVWKVGKERAEDAPVGACGIWIRRPLMKLLLSEIEIMLKNLFAQHARPNRLPLTLNSLLWSLHREHSFISAVRVSPPLVSRGPAYQFWSFSLPVEPFHLPKFKIPDWGPRLLGYSEQGSCVFSEKNQTKSEPSNESPQASLTARFEEKKNSLDFYCHLSAHLPFHYKLFHSLLSSSSFSSIILQNIPSLSSYLSHFFSLTTSLRFENGVAKSYSSQWSGSPSDFETEELFEDIQEEKNYLGNEKKVFNQRNDFERKNTLNSIDNNSLRKVVVIMSIYHPTKLLHVSLSSILFQMVAPWNLILLTDPSDGTPDYLRSFFIQMGASDEKVLIIESEKTRFSLMRKQIYDSLEDGAVVLLLDQLDFLTSPLSLYFLSSSFTPFTPPEDPSSSADEMEEKEPTEERREKRGEREEKKENERKSISEYMMVMPTLPYTTRLFEVPHLRTKWAFNFELSPTDHLPIFNERKPVKEKKEIVGQKVRTVKVSRKSKQNNYFQNLFEEKQLMRKKKRFAFSECRDLLGDGGSYTIAFLSESLKSVEKELFFFPLLSSTLWDQEEDNRTNFGNMKKIDQQKRQQERDWRIRSLGYATGRGGMEFEWLSTAKNKTYRGIFEPIVSTFKIGLRPCQTHCRFPSASQFCRSFIRYSKGQESWTGPIRLEKEEEGEGEREGQDGEQGEKEIDEKWEGEKNIQGREKREKTREKGYKGRQGHMTKKEGLTRLRNSFKFKN